MKQSNNKTNALTKAYGIRLSPAITPAVRHPFFKLEHRSEREGVASKSRTTPRVQAIDTGRANRRPYFEGLNSCVTHHDWYAQRSANSRTGTNPFLLDTAVPLPPHNSAHRQATPPPVRQHSLLITSKFDFSEAAHEFRKAEAKGFAFNKHHCWQRVKGGDPLL